MKTTTPTSVKITIGLFAALLFCGTASAASALAKSAALANAAASTKKTAAKKETVGSSIKKTRAHFQSLLKQKPGYYLECKHVPPVPIKLTKEDFQKTYLSLSGLTGVHLDVDGLIKAAGQKNAKFTENLKDLIKKKLAIGGLKLLSEEEMENTPGQPEMSMFMSFPAHMTPAKGGKQQAVYRPDCCTVGIWTSFTQAARILRDPNTNYKLGTWGEGHNTNDCSDPASWMNDIILTTVDNFVIKKLEADKDYSTWMTERAKLQKTSGTTKLKKTANKKLAVLKQEKKPAPPKAKPKPKPKAKPVAPKPKAKPQPKAKPVAPKPKAKPAVVAQPVTQQVLVQQPAAQTLLVQQPTVQTMLVEQPATQTIYVQQPTQTVLVEQPAVQTVLVQQPTVQTMVVEQPAVQTILVEQPAMQTMVAQQPYNQLMQYQQQSLYTTQTTPSAAPESCNDSVKTYIDMFATNQTHIDSANYYVLDL